MILERVYDSALSRLAGKKIKEVRIGLELMAVELDDGAIGVTYVLRKEIGHACAALPKAGSLLGMPAGEVAGWTLQGRNVITVAMGLAVLNSVAEFDKLEQVENPSGADAIFSVEIQPTDTVGIIGHIGPIIANLNGKVHRLLIFERGESATGHVYPESAQPELLPECKVVFISSTSLINRTLEKLLNYCTGARDVVMVGSSTPLYPDAFSGSGVTVLSGTRWQLSHRDAIHLGISQCAGMKQLIKYGQKMSVKVK
ncbi:hypothetical protein Psfp_04109 [Pelotomaculum sp. FP]|uniref:Rossmann-like domain-containing protein n=1 Tax=Pelotomaculum sp. FP TaxID=261474 RepID=UPI001104A126|nr:DUF364 domain-containing protein [Pelotomaculum sp. FP]TEB10751.1 hypothetical protein Psfp_04109 [Pelotomaculum sp. FP]